ncbi:MAG: response regulator [Xanthobacteraceae bacterium]|jgi:two-component system chemotaxis response regulator CheY
MIDELLSLRALVVSTEHGLRDLFRQASSSSTVPLEVVEATDASSCRAPAATADLAYLDGALELDELTRVTATIRAAAKPAFTVHLVAGAAAPIFETDGLAGKPSRLEEAKWLLDRSIRVRLPSRVLIVDDSSTMRTIVRKTLAATRFPLETSEADEGMSALERVREGAFDIVFLDYNMPNFNGLETLAEFKREQRGITVVMMSSTEDDELAEKARGFGAAFLKKPFFPPDIEAVLSGFYGLRGLNSKRA